MLRLKTYNAVLVVQSSHVFGLSYNRDTVNNKSDSKMFPEFDFNEFLSNNSINYWLKSVKK